MFLADLFNLNKKCQHERVLPDVEQAYCPDCGKLIKNEWYITRCACCGVKLRTVQRGDKIEPLNHYCTNCGSGEFKPEKLAKINFVDINFAVLHKRVIENENLAYSTQCWQEKTDVQPKLLVQYL